MYNTFHQVAKSVFLLFAAVVFSAAKGLFSLFYVPYYYNIF